MPRPEKKDVNKISTSIEKYNKDFKNTVKDFKVIQFESETGEMLINSDDLGKVTNIVNDYFDLKKQIEEFDRDIRENINLYTDEDKSAFSKIKDNFVETPFGDAEIAPKFRLGLLKSAENLLEKEQYDTASKYMEVYLLKTFSMRDINTGDIKKTDNTIQAVSDMQELNLVEKCVSKLSNHKLEIKKNAKNSVNKSDELMGNLDIIDLQDNSDPSKKMQNKVEELYDNLFKFTLIEGKKSKFSIEMDTVFNKMNNEVDENNKISDKTLVDTIIAVNKYVDHANTKRGIHLAFSRTAKNRKKEALDMQKLTQAILNIRPDLAQAVEKEMNNQAGGNGMNNQADEEGMNNQADEEKMNNQAGDEDKYTKNPGLLDDTIFSFDARKGDLKEKIYLTQKKIVAPDKKNTNTKQMDIDIHNSYTKLNNNFNDKEQKLIKKAQEKKFQFGGMQ